MNAIEYERQKELTDDFDSVRLRPIKDEDTDLIVRWRNNPVIRSQFIFRELFSSEMHRRWLSEKVYTGSVIQYIIEVEKNPIGSIYLRDVNLKNESGEFGIFIGEIGYHGKGYGTIATKMFVKYCFELGFHRIFLRVLDTNAAAQRSYIKAGFEYEGTARDMVYIDGIRYNVTFMSVIAK
ncbi:MAG: GNAT family N-acetyltransferase [Lachnospiraceae bacterium]|nr:GNAT family N-acetyltransferase [Lachnospiraceae bacterium]